MRLPQLQINPTSRVASSLHILYMILLPLLVLGLVRSNFTSGAILIVILSKWRMFAVRPRYWIANIRANSVDIIVGISTVIFMSQSSNLRSALIWSGIYAVWLVFLKPRSSPLLVVIQALIAQAIGLIAVFNNFSTWHQVYLVLSAWIISYSAARHLLSPYDDNGLDRMLANLWALFAAELTLVLGKWHIVYLNVLPQIALIILIIGYTLAIAYYVHHSKDGLNKGTKRQLIGFSVALLVIMIILTNWQPEAL